MPHCSPGLKQEEIWVQEEDEEEVGKEVQLEKGFRPSSRGLFRQKTNITQPIIDGSGVATTLMNTTKTQQGSRASVISGRTKRTYYFTA